MAGEAFWNPLPGTGGGGGGTSPAWELVLAPTGTSDWSSVTGWTSPSSGVFQSTAVDHTLGLELDVGFGLYVVFDFKRVSGSGTKLLRVFPGVSLDTGGAGWHQGRIDAANLYWERRNQATVASVSMPTITDDTWYPATVWASGPSYRTTVYQGATKHYLASRMDGEANARYLYIKSSETTAATVQIRNVKVYRMTEGSLP